MNVVVAAATVLRSLVWLGPGGVVFLLVCREVWSADSLSVVQIGGSCANRTSRCRAPGKGPVLDGCCVGGALGPTGVGVLPARSRRYVDALVLRLPCGCVRGDSIAHWPMVLIRRKIGCLPIGQAS